MADWIGYPPALARDRKAALGANRLDGRDGGRKRGAVQDGPTQEERNRQKEIQDIMMAAEDPEPILAIVRDVDGAIAVSTALHRLGKIGSPDVTRDERFQILMQKFEERLPFCGSRQIANSMHGLGKLLFRRFGPWVNMLCVQTQRRIHEFEPQHVSNTLWACARMQLQDKLLLRTLLGRAVEDLGRMCPVDLSIITWACATLKFRDQDWLRAIVRAHVDFADFSPQNMANFVWGLATLGFRNDNMVLAVGREAAKKLPDFIPQELSNYCWALATMDLCDNLMLRAVSEEVERRGASELRSWDPQSLSNMMWAYATLAVKDDVLFDLLLDASVARIEDHDTQNLANSSWAAAMVVYRKSAFLQAVAQAIMKKLGEASGLHLAQLAFAFSRFCFQAEGQQVMPGLLRETLHRLEDFAPQSLIDVQDALAFFGAMAAAPNRIEQTIGTFYEDLVHVMERFARLHADGQQPTASQVSAYQRDVERRDVVSLGFTYSNAFLRHFGLLCSEQDAFIPLAREQIRVFRDAEASRDPMSRSTFHRAQCVWALREEGSEDSCVALADGVFESGAPMVGQGPDAHGLTVCRLRHPRDGDAEVQALCAALSTSLFRGASASRSSGNKTRFLAGFKLNLHLSEVPCISCLGCTLQFQFRYPGVLRVSFDRGRQVAQDSTPLPRPPPHPSVCLPPVAPRSSESGGDAAAADRCMIRKEGPDLREVTSFYSSAGSGGRPRRQAVGAAMGGMEAVPHKLVSNGSKGSSQQTYYFSVRPEFLSGDDYTSYNGGKKSTSE